MSVLLLLLNKIKKGSGAGGNGVPANALTDDSDVLLTDDSGIQLLDDS